MIYQFPGHEKTLKSIKKFLDTHTIPNPKELKDFFSKLDKIHNSLSEALSHTTPLFQREHLKQQKALVDNLSGRCLKLEVRHSVIHLAEEAEELANSSPNRPHNEIASEADILRGRIRSFIEKHRPSKNNAKFLRFANACIDKAEKHEPVLIKTPEGKVKKVIKIEHFQRKEVSIESFSLAEELYELAGHLYKEEIDLYEDKWKRFSDHEKNEVKHHVSACHGDLTKIDSVEDRLTTIQGILGYAHELTDYYMQSSPYPPIVEIHKIFSDLDFISHIDEDS